MRTSTPRRDRVSTVNTDRRRAGRRLRAARRKRVERPSRETRAAATWDSVREAGCYANADSGDLFRISVEALRGMRRPIIQRESRRPARLVLLSDDPFVHTAEARMLSARRDVAPNF